MKKGPKLLRIVLLLLVAGLVPWLAQAQEGRRTIKGKVVDATSGEALIGVSVYVSNKTIGAATGTDNVIENISIGAITNEKGEFTLSLSDSLKAKQLTVNYMGYETKLVNITSSNTYQIALGTSGKNLSEFVFTGYQTIRKNKSTGATDKITMDKIDIGGVMGVDQMLQGQLAGVAISTLSGAPGQAAKIRIRGTSSLQGAQDPLWVVDGLPIEGNNLPDMKGNKDIDQLYTSSIAGYSPADIESITVLKDAAATAIYGARAANGVIVVTTKSGKKGDRLSVNYRNNFTFTQKPDISRLNLMNSDQKVNLELDLFTSDYDFRATNGDVSRILNKYGVTPAELSGKGFGGINAAARNEINALRGINTDWNDLLFRSAFTQEHSVSVSGGGDKSAYYFSGGYYDEQGAVKGTGAQRYNITLKTDFDLSEKLKFSAGLFANQRKQSSYLTNAAANTNPTNYSRMANPYTRVKDDNGNYIYDRNIMGEESILDFNVLEEQSNTSNINKAQAVNANFKLDYEVIPRLHISTQLGVQTENKSIESIALENTYFVRHQADITQRFDPATGNKNTFLPKGGIINNSQEDLQQYTLKTMAEYNFNLQKKHDFTFLAGNELRRITTKGMTKVGYGYDPQTLTTIAPKFQNDNEASILFKDKNTYLENAFVSFFGTGSYTYNNKYTVAGSIRFDGSDMFGVDPKYKYLPLWSVSGLWRVMEEPFMKQVNFINTLNLRASYGLQGNVDKNTSPFVMGKYGRIGLLPGQLVDVIDVSAPPNAKLRWEKTINTNYGIDLSLFKNKVNITVDYYTRHGKDLINVYSLPLETGFQMMSVNWAEMRNSGLEISINTRNITRKDFRWSTDFNFAYNKNKVLQETLADNSFVPSRVGHPVGVLWGLDYAGMNDKGMVMVNKDGQVISFLDYLQIKDDFASEPELAGLFPYSTLTNDQQRELYKDMGTSDPLYTGGLTNNFSYKRFDLSIGLMFNLGQKVRLQPFYSPIAYNRGTNTNTAILDRWTPANVHGSYPALLGNNSAMDPQLRLLGRWYEQRPEHYNNLSMWIRNGGYVRVRNITLGYRLPEEMGAKIRLKGLKVVAEARNPFVFSNNYDGYLDPETMGNPYAQPIPKTYTIGINATF
ncbi:SusC/RagA family TonB-linked outer membrane protein [Chitinophaga nivalis]|uniref:SusC/RagA family TonB-linked outer membrane protein n=1 Tax=Chitinophaga nivalis TaxID=2991709 RepID=A0ABT3IRK7_9BACT|nr:SusC/RagA family TonB-linked outer membrane protein [Chitinophaga nivalis]MCW3463794.1 SusC/RagA family TonB-linked outer membrane protein [Chitinophaga nivalis]MCW3486516.1 SusC/RagA family TonB-linked outer membrane protein [Chitinophaga nivalis]